MTNKKKVSKKDNKKSLYKVLITALVALLAIGAGVGVSISIQSNEEGYKAQIEFSGEQKPVEITDQSEIENVEGGQGEVKIDGETIQTVEAVESDGPVTETGENECPEGEECGRGAAYPSLDISSPQAFANATLGQCINVDGYYGSQCWDSMSAFFYNYAGRILNTCGTGAAKGTITDGCWQKNAGNEFVMIWNPRDIQAGDIAVYSTGQWGHIGMAMGGYNNGYFALLGQNQGGRACPGGGAAGNIINLSTRDFIGAFRPKAYIKPEPKPAPAPTPAPQPQDNKVTYTYVKGDYFSKVLVRLGLDEGKLWGKNGTVNYYTKQLIEQNVLDKRGNVKIGVPFTLIKR